MMEDYPFEFNEDTLEMVTKHIASISVEKEIDPIYWREPIASFISVLRSQAHAMKQGEKFGLMIEHLAKNIFIHEYNIRSKSQAMKLLDEEGADVLDDPFDPYTGITPQEFDIVLETALELYKIAQLRLRK